MYEPFGIGLFYCHEDLCHASGGQTVKGQRKNVKVRGMRFELTLYINES
jgi:hypothetical protein